MSSFPASILTCFSNINSETSRDKAVPPKIQMKGCPSSPCPSGCSFNFYYCPAGAGRLDQTGSVVPWKALLQEHLAHICSQCTPHSTTGSSPSEPDSPQPSPGSLTCGIFWHLLHLVPCHSRRPGWWRCNPSAAHSPASPWSGLFPHQWIYPLPLLQRERSARGS